MSRDNRGFEHQEDRPIPSTQPMTQNRGAGYKPPTGGDTDLMERPEPKE